MDVLLPAALPPHAPQARVAGALSGREHDGLAISITQNKKATFDYFIVERYEAGLVPEGWEVKAIRAGRAEIKEGYVIICDGALYLIGSHISPLPETSTHVKPDPTRTRKLLLKGDEIKRLIGRVEQRGYTLVPLDLRYKNGRIQLEVGLGRGKQKADKRESEKQREWNREKRRIMNTRNR
jgi:SsrA-binding protein